MRPGSVFQVLAGLLVAALMAGCAGRGEAPTTARAASNAASNAGKYGLYKIGSPYKVEGVWYYPGVDYNYNETGIASWYGPDFHGKNTANGEVYNMNDLTAAHPTLPLPSIVRVTNLENGRSIIVRVNDRGPYVRGRIIDLSRRGAQLLGMIGTGTARVRVQIMADESRQAVLLAQQGEIPSIERIAASAPRESVTAQVLAAPPAVQVAALPPLADGASRPAPAPAAIPLIASAQAAAQPAAPTVVLKAPPGAAEPQVSVAAVAPTAIYVQVGAFSQFENANRMRVRLASLGPAKVTQTNVDGLPFFRVRLGPAATVPEADKLLDLAVRAGYHDARIVIE